MSAIGSTEVKNPGAAKIEGKVEFKVAKSWIATDNIDEATVKLNRYDGSGENWNALTTSKVGENDATVFFRGRDARVFYVRSDGRKEGGGRGCSGNTYTNTCGGSAYARSASNDTRSNGITNTCIRGTGLRDDFRCGIAVDSLHDGV